VARVERYQNNACYKWHMDVMNGLDLESVAALSLLEKIYYHDTSHNRTMLISGNTGINAWERRCQSKKHNFSLSHPPEASADGLE
jgi:hypothetical protein